MRAVRSCNSWFNFISLQFHRIDCISIFLYLHIKVHYKLIKHFFGKSKSTKGNNCSKCDRVSYRVRPFMVLCSFHYCMKDGWVNDLRFYVLGNSISVITGRCLDNNERLCAMELRLQMRRFTSSEDRTRSA